MKYKCIALLAVILMLAGCGKKEVQDIAAQDSNETGIEGNVEETSEYSDEVFLKDLFNESGNLKLVFGTGEDEYEELGYDYKIPLINSDKPGALEINKKLTEEFDGEIASLNELKLHQTEILPDGLTYPTWVKIDYRSYWNDSVLSLVISKLSPFDDWTEYTVFNYDARTDSILTRKDVFTLAGYSENQVVSDVRRGEMYFYDDMLSNLFENYFEDRESIEAKRIYTDYIRMRGTTLMRDPLDDENLYYMDEEGLKVIATMDVPAAGGLLRTDIKLVTSQENNYSKTYMDCVDVECINGEISVCINQNEWSKEAFAGSRIEFGKSYSVGSVYKNYSDCVIVDLGNAHMPYPVFLADDGILAYIDIAQCAQAGAFFMTEPMYGIEHINRFEEEAGNVFIERKSGEKINLQECLDIAVNNNYPGFIKQLIGLYDIEGFILNKTVGDESIPQYYFGFDSEDESRFLLQDYVSDEHRMEGSLSYIGTDENGMVLSFILNRDNDEDMPEELWKKGLWNLKEDGYWDDEAGLYYSYLYLTPISGDDIFDNNMETVKMEKSYG